MRELVILFTTFFKIGMFTFGGGYAMLPILQRELVEKRKWATDEEILNYIAIGQCTPGVIAVNTATFVGSMRKGVIGGIVATIALCVPSIIIITVIAAFFQNFSDLALVQRAFAGVRVCVAVLIISAVIRLFRSSVKDHWGVFIFLAVFFLMVLTDISPVILIVLSGVTGFFIRFAGGGKK